MSPPPTNGDHPPPVTTGGVPGPVRNSPGKVRTRQTRLKAAVITCSISEGDSKRSRTGWGGSGDSRARRPSRYSCEAVVPPQQLSEVGMIRWKVGDVTVTKVLEMEMTIPISKFLPSATDADLERHAWVTPYFLTSSGEAIVSFHGLVVDTGPRRILVDTCIGNDRVMPQLPVLHGPFLENLAEAGYQPADIDTVVCTHLHLDHVGWNTRLIDGQWVPTFANARYIFGRVEWEYWLTGAEGPLNLDDTVRPVIDAGLADLVETDYQVAPEVRLEPTPGHTPGHAGVVITSRGQTAFITGDLVHHPLQLAEPHIGNPADCDAARACQTRRKFVSRCSDGHTLVIGTHFAGPTGGRLEAEPDGGTWRLAI